MSDENEKLRAHVRVLNEELQKHSGTIAALEGAIHALILSHTNPAELKKQISGGLEIVEALFLGGSKSEVGLVAFQDARKRIDDSSRTQPDPQVPGK